MMNPPNLIKEIENELLKENILADFVQITQYAYDEFLNEEVLKNAPFIGPFVKGGKLILSIPDKLLMTKLLYFMDGLRKNNISYDKRLDFYEEVNRTHKKLRKVGYDLLSIIERSDELDKVQIIAEAFSFCLIGKICYSTFLRLSHGVNNSYALDLLNLTCEDDKLIKLSKENLLMSGFVKIRTGKTWNDVGTNYFELNELGNTLVEIIQALKSKTNI